MQLSKDVQDWIDGQVRAGRFPSEEALIEDALRQQMVKQDVERLRARLEESERQAARGETIVADDAFFEGLRQGILERAAKRRQ